MTYPKTEQSAVAMSMETCDYMSSSLISRRYAGQISDTDPRSFLKLKGIQAVRHVEIRSCIEY